MSDYLNDPMLEYIIAQGSEGSLPLFRAKDFSDFYVSRVAADPELREMDTAEEIRNAGVNAFQENFASTADRTLHVLRGLDMAQPQASLDFILTQAPDFSQPANAGLTQYIHPEQAGRMFSDMAVYALTNSTDPALKDQYINILLDERYTYLGQDGMGLIGAILRNPVFVDTQGQQPEALFGTDAFDNLPLVQLLSNLTPEQRDRLFGNDGAASEYNIGSYLEQLQAQGAVGEGTAELLGAAEFGTFVQMHFEIRDWAAGVERSIEENPAQALANVMQLVNETNGLTNANRDFFLETVTADRDAATDGFQRTDAESPEFGALQLFRLFDNLDQAQLDMLLVTMSAEEYNAFLANPVIAQALEDRPDLVPVIEETRQQSVDLAPYNAVLAAAFERAKGNNVGSVFTPDDLNVIAGNEVFLERAIASGLVAYNDVGVLVVANTNPYVMLARIALDDEVISREELGHLAYGGNRRDALEAELEAALGGVDLKDGAREAAFILADLDNSIHAFLVSLGGNDTDDKNAALADLQSALNEAGVEGVEVNAAGIHIPNSRGGSGGPQVG